MSKYCFGGLHHCRDLAPSANIILICTHHTKQVQVPKTRPIQTVQTININSITPRLTPRSSHALIGHCSPPPIPTPSCPALCNFASGPRGCRHIELGKRWPPVFDSPQDSFWNRKFDEKLNAPHALEHAWKMLRQVVQLTFANQCVSCMGFKSVRLLVKVRRDNSACCAVVIVGELQRAG
jgi:hypothetical protein